MKPQTALNRHPRLYLAAGNLSGPKELQWLKLARQRVRRRADEYAASLELSYPRNVHNEHLVRASE
ncbi:MAG: hypothetical protein WC299_14480, partial [Kiritimatiellia bacterium]